MIEPELCFIKETYFRENSEFIKMLDTGNADKQAKRTHLCMLIEQNNNRFCIPLRNNLGPEIRKYGRIGHSVPSQKRSNAGLDYRYAVIVNDLQYIEVPKEKRIPQIQYRRIKKDYELIKMEFSVYLRGFVKAVRKGRQEKEPLYRESSLINFVDELGISK